MLALATRAGMEEAALCLMTWPCSSNIADGVTIGMMDSVVGVTVGQAGKEECVR